MNIYEYNSSSINEYFEDICGLITSTPREFFDCGKITDNSEIKEDYYVVNSSTTLYPFGSIKIQSIKTKFKKVSAEFRKFGDLNHRSIIFYGIIINWIGFNVIFESDSSLKRQVITDISGGEK